MQKRHNRIPVNIKADLISSVKTYEGFIMNLSDDGIYAVATPTKTATDFIPGNLLKVKLQNNFIPGNLLKVKLQNNSGETLNLNCEVKWLHTYKTSPHDLTNGMGIEIIDTPQEYRDFFIFKVVE
jgi:hypothetical protein